MISARRIVALLSPLLLLPLVAVTAATPGASAARGAAADPDALFTPLSGFRPGTGDQVRVRPSQFRAYRVDLAGLRTALSGGGTRTLDLPAPTGEVATFRVVEDSVMEPSLQAAHPEIRTYAGRGPGGSTIRLDVTPMGFHAFVRNPDGRAWYVDPAVNRVGEDRVLSYLGGAVPRAEEAFVERELRRHGQTAAPGVAPGPGGIVSTRTYRLALLTDKSYADRFGSANVLSEKTTLVNRVNEVYNDDLAIRFVMVAGTDTKLNFDTDAEQTGPDGPCGANPCFTEDEIAGCDGPTLDRNEFVLGQLIGADNFDIGHLGLGVNGGGIAGLGVVGGPDKAAGCTGLPNPTGDFYAIDYVAHEIGHQMGGDHTFNGTEWNCAPGNRNTTPYATQVEPGSGSSIMAYAGICQQDNLQPHSDPYFSFSSVDEINATTAAAPTNDNEQQVVNFSGLDTGEQFTLSCAGCPTSSTITFGPNPAYTVDLTAAVLAVTGQAGLVSGYDGAPAADATGFTVDWSASTADVPTLTVTPVSGTFTSFTGTTFNGGPTDEQGTVSTSTNSSPVVTAPADKTIPARTPFTLTGSATDPNAGDTLTYLWEQTDPGGADGTALVDNNKTDGPLFRQFGVAATVTSANTLLYHSPGENLAGTSPSRTFPDLAQILVGNTNAASGSCPAAPAPPASGGATNVPAATVDCYSEFLPTAAWVGNPLTPRVLHFRLTARDEFTPDAAADHPGGLSTDDVALTVNPAAGPFLVTSRAAGGVAGGAETVTWDIAGTATAALAQNVRISLSTDGGLTFPTVLAASTPNDGSQAVTLPKVTTRTARIKVEAVGNYFFDVNDANFSIGSVLAAGQGRFASVPGSSKRAPDAKGPAKFRFTVLDGATGTAAFRFKKGRIAFTGDDLAGVKVVSGKRIRFTVKGTNKGKAGYKLVVTALDKGARDRIRVRVLKHHRLVYDSMPGKKPAARPRTPVKGQITIP